MSAHLEKMLRHAEKRLGQTAKKGPRDLLDLYKNFLKQEEQQLLKIHREGERGVHLAQKRAAMVDVVLRHIWQTALASTKNAHHAADKENSLALIAVGGFGRRELNPHSDVDLLFLYDGALQKPKTSGLLNDIVEQTLYVLWDVGFKVGHACRTLNEVVEDGNADLRTKTSLLESCLIAGSEHLYAEFQTHFFRHCVEGKEAEYLEWRLRDQEDRHRRYGGTVFVQEPNIKNGCGGLRDYQNLLWVARVQKKLSSTKQLKENGWLTKDEHRRIDRAYDFLLRVRNELHYQQGRADDVLTLRLEGKIAEAFHYPQRNVLRRTEAFMRDYYGPAKDIFHITNLLARRLIEETRGQEDNFWSFLPIGKNRSVKIDGFLLKDDQLHLESRNIFSDPLKILRVFQIMQQHDARLSPELETFLRAKASLVDYRFLWVPEAREIFNDILKKKGKVGRVIRAMHETGILGRLMPEFEPLTCLVQHEFFHVYTADEHTLVCLEQLDKVLDCPEQPFKSYREIFLKCEHPEILYTALILHDVGKAKSMSQHHEMSAQLAARFARRMKFKSHRLHNLLFLVYQHGTLSEFAQRRNLDEIDTIREFARIVGDEQRLDLLMLMTFADAQGVSGNVAGANWTGWKELLVWNLYHKTREMLKGEEEFLENVAQAQEEIAQNVRKKIKKQIPDDEIFIHISLLPPRYLNCTSEELMVRHVELVHQFISRRVVNDDNGDVLRPIIEWIHKENEGHSEVIVVTWDRDLLFSKIAGAFALTELNILSADVFTREDNIIVDTFRVCTERYEAVTNKIDHRNFQETLTQSLQDEKFDFCALLTRKQASVQHPLEDAEFATILKLDNETSSEQTLLHIQTPDRLGLLFNITSCLADFGISISHSRITTEKGAALDVFYLVPPDGGKILDLQLQEKLLDALKRAILP